MSNRRFVDPLAVAVVASLMVTPATEGEVFMALRHDTSLPLRQILAAAPALEAAVAIPQDIDLGPQVPAFLANLTPPPILEPAAPVDFSPLAEAAPSIGLSFSGYSQDDNRDTAVGAPAPPDINGDVGVDHYIQYVNLGFLIFDKTGNRVEGPVEGNAFWDGFGGPCEEKNAGDPIVLYDHLEDRWFFSQFTGSDNADGGRQCVALSATDDPLGRYHRYEFRFDGVFNDYPKVGLWQDAGGRRSGYYLTTNDFAGGFSHASIAVLQRPQMLVGGPARMVRFTVPPAGTSVFFSLQPPHLEGAELPPEGDCASFVMAFDAQVWNSGNGDDGYQLWQLCVNWNNAPASTLTGPELLASEGFDSNLCGFSPCIEQPDTNNRLDVSGQFTGYRATVRVLDGVPHMVVAHTVDVGQDHAGVRWAQIRLDGSPALVAQGVYSPDGEDRWMGSASLDAAGNVAIGYSVAGDSTHPGLRFTGRIPTDAPGKMRTESTCVDGGGSATGVSRWGDYASMSVDPVDQCTFWFTGEFMDTTSARNWTTRVCTFRFENCGTP